MPGCITLQTGFYCALSWKYRLETLIVFGYKDSLPRQMIDMRA